MFRWDRLLRRSKSKKHINYIQDEIELDHKSGEDVIADKEEYEIVEIEILPKKLICPDCGGITLEGLEFCDKCGGEL